MMGCGASGEQKTESTSTESIPSSKPESPLPISYYKTEHGWGASKSGPGLDDSSVKKDGVNNFGNGIAHHIKTNGKGSGKTHTFETEFGTRTAADQDGFLYIYWGERREVSENCPTGWHHMQWVIAATSEKVEAIEKVRDWMDNGGEAPAKELMQAAAAEIWRVHGLKVDS
mmetsp:Transcript_16180/g.30120  ORF Transcript_16180/g.30120 Transcript_16180/m.30120 type:complete len:171 (-) Transcript_16180:98-610(-)